MRVQLDKITVEKLLKDGYSQQMIADHYSTDGKKCSRSKVQAFIREHIQGKPQSLGNAGNDVAAVANPAVMNRSYSVPASNIHPETALWYEQQEKLKLMQQLAETKAKLTAEREKNEKLKDENRDLKQEQLIRDNSKPSGLAGIMESPQTPDVMNGFANIISSIGTLMANKNSQPAATLEPSISSDAQAIINVANSTLYSNASDLVKLEALVTLIRSAAEPVNAEWLNAAVHNIKNQANVQPQ